MDAILKTLSLVMNKNRRNKVFTMIKQLKMREYSAHFDFSLNCYVHVIFYSTVHSSLTSCIQNVVDIFGDAVDVTSSTTRHRHSNVPAFLSTGCSGKVEPARRKYFLNLPRPEVIINFNLLGNRGISLFCM